MNKKLMEILEGSVDDCIDKRRVHDQIIELWKEDKLLKTCKDIFNIAEQRYKWERNSNEDSEGWLKVAEIAGQAITQAQKNMEG